MTNEPPNGQVPDAAVTAYLDLLERCLSRTLFPEQYEALRWRGPVRRPLLTLDRMLRARGLEVVRRIDPARGVDRSLWPPEAETMLPPSALANVRRCVIDVVSRGVPGDLIETGVWRGGATIMMRAVLKAMGDGGRVVWVADSFNGLPKPDPARWPADRGLNLDKLRQFAVPAEEVRRNFERYGLLDDQVRFLEGWFSDTLHAAPIQQLAVLRLDGDMYGSTIEALEALYPKVSPGGYVIVDDFGAFPGCRHAVNDYRVAHGISEPMRNIHADAVYWQRGAASDAARN